MRIKRIELENWLAFKGSYFLDLPAGPIAVTATYINNPRRSNWAGKTAFLEAIRWALFGKHRKRTDDAIIHRGTPNTRVRLVFTDDLTVTRSKSMGKPVRLAVEHAGEKYTKKLAQTQIVKILGLTDDDLCNTLHFAQGDIEAICDRQSSKRRDVVGAWLDLESWARVASRIRARSKLMRENLDRARTNLERLDADAFEISDVVAWSEDEAGEDLERSIGHAAGELFANRERQSEIDVILEDVAADEIRAQNRIRFDRIRDDVDELKTKIRGLNLGDVKRELEEAAAAAEFAASGVIASERDVRAARQLVKGDFDGVCPVTCESCPIADDIRANTAAARTKLATARARYTDDKSTADDLKRAFRELETQHRAGIRLVDGFNSKRAELARIKESTPDAEPRRSDEEVTELKRERRALIDTALDIAGRYSVARRDARRFGHVIKKRAETAAEVAGFEAELRLYTIAARCVGPSGVPARIAERELGQLEERANVVLSDVGLSFRFSWDRELRDRTPTCYDCGYRFKGQADKSCPSCQAERPLKRSDELGILVSDGGPEEDVKTKSGGAKVLIGSAIRLAAGAMLRDIRDTRAAWATIDEPFGPLDAENRQALASSFAGLLGSVGLEQAFVVSHDAALLDALPGRIEITREGSSSSIAIR